MRYNPPMTKTTKTPQTTEKHDHSGHNHAAHDHDEHNHPHQQSDLIGPNSTLVITIPWKKAKEVYDKALKQLAKSLKIDGFRKGMVPPHIAEQHLGQIKVIEKSLDKLLPEMYTDAIKKAKKQPLTQPDFKPLKIEMGKDWEIEAIFAELPEVKLGKYEPIVKKAKKSAEKMIKDAQKPIKPKKGEEVDKITNPEITENQKKETILHHVFKNLAEEIKPQVPELLLQHETRQEFDHLVKNLQQMNLKAEEYLEKRGITIEQLSNEMAAAALGRLQLDLILGEIAKQEKFKASKEDVTDYLNKIQDEITKKLLEGNTAYKNQLETTIIRQKVIDHLLNM